MGPAGPPGYDTRERRDEAATWVSEPEMEWVMGWVYVALAGLFEIAWAYGLKRNDGFSRLWPSVGTVIAMAGSFVLLSAAMKQLPLGTAYAVRTGIGAVGTALVGIALLGESAAWPRLACIGLVAVGIIGLKVVSD